MMLVVKVCMYKFFSNVGLCVVGFNLIVGDLLVIEVMIDFLWVNVVMIVVVVLLDEVNVWMVLWGVCLLMVIGFDDVVEGLILVCDIFGEKLM